MAFQILKKILGPKLTKVIRPFGHGIKAHLASWKYKQPAKKLKIIGITGTKGKTSSVIILGRLLNQMGVKAGYLSTAVINNNGQRKDEILNPYKMTSIDAIAMQKEIKQMVDNKCEYLVIELSSEGLVQNRHQGLFGIDIGVFLNIYPEHIESHGSFENYIKAKSTLFKNIKNGGVIITNDNPEMKQMSDKMFDLLPFYKKNKVKRIGLQRALNYQITSNQETKALYKNIKFQETSYQTTCLADFEVTNLAFALNIAQIVNSDKLNSFLNNSQTINPLNNLTQIPGRMDWVVKKGVLLE
jgi:UDP-N-acetylmuramoyl-L-alanyl-D-glutamate--2,6-diaminopimelate ligase